MSPAPSRRWMRRDSRCSGVSGRGGGRSSRGEGGGGGSAPSPTARTGARRRRRAGVGHVAAGDWADATGDGGTFSPRTLDLRGRSAIADIPRASLAVPCLKGGQTRGRLVASRLRSSEVLQQASSRCFPGILSLVLPPRPRPPSLDDYASPSDARPGSFYVGRQAGLQGASGEGGSHGWIRSEHVLGLSPRGVMTSGPRRYPSFR